MDNGLPDNSRHDIRTYGAVGDGVAIDTAAIQQAIDACHEAGGGTVVVPGGLYLTGTLYLKSHVTLHLSAGAVLRGSPRREDYNPDDIFPENPVFAQENVTGAHLVIAYRAEHVAITGDGTIDGNSPAFFDPLAPEQEAKTYRHHPGNFPIRDWRPGQMVFFCRCTNVAVRDVSLVNSPYWTLLLLGCRHVHVRGLTLCNPMQTANGDGLDLDCCQDVTVSDCLITVGDDAITLRGHSRLLGEHAQPCERVVVSNCILSTPCNAIRVGVGDGIVRNCSFSNIIVKNTRSGINMVCAYSPRSAHGVTIENIHFSHFLMDTVVPLSMLLGQTAKPPAAIRDVSFSHFRMRGEQGCFFGGHEGHPLSNIQLHEIDLRLTGGEVDAEFAAKTPRPYGDNGVPAALWARQVEGLRVSGLRVTWEDVSGDWQHGLVLEHCSPVSLKDVEALPPPTSPTGQAIHWIGKEA